MLKKILRAHDVHKRRKRRRPKIRGLDDMLEYLRRMDVMGATLSLERIGIVGEDWG